MYAQDFYIPEQQIGISRNRDALELNEKYYLQAFPEFYFIVRRDKFYDGRYLQRVCLYQENVINRHLFGHDMPGDMLVTNELRDGRTLAQITHDMSNNLTVRYGKVVFLR